MATIGIIQTGGIGDIIIAIPIADFFIQQGHTVVWPIDAAYLSAFERAKPAIRFIGVPGGDRFDVPARLLHDARCDEIFTLYSYYSEKKVYDEGLSRHLTFDQYKYAIAHVPFHHKWTLRIERDMQREHDLHRRLNITRPYICVHRHGSSAQLNFTLPPSWTNEFQVVEITPLTDSPFDWIYTLEKASKLFLLESCFSNLVEQLKLPCEKYLILKAPAPYTPVLVADWNWVVVDGPNDHPILRIV